MSTVIHEQDLGQDNVDWIRRITRPGQKDAHDVSGEARDSHGQWTAGGGDDAATLAMLDASLEEQSGERLESMALHSYQGSNSDQINLRLREGFQASTANGREIDAQVKAIDALMQPLSSARVLYRAIGEGGLNELLGDTPTNQGYSREAVAALVGKIVQDEGFMSTTSDKGIAGEKTESNAPYVVEISAPKGTLAIDIASRDLGDPDYNFEKEVLIEHGTRMRIDSVSDQKVGGFSRARIGSSGKVYVIHMSVMK